LTGSVFNNVFNLINLIKYAEQFLVVDTRISHCREVIHSFLIHFSLNRIDSFVLHKLKFTPFEEEIFVFPNFLVYSYFIQLAVFLSIVQFETDSFLSEHVGKISSSKIYDTNNALTLEVMPLIRIHFHLILSFYY